MNVISGCSPRMARVASLDDGGCGEICALYLEYCIHCDVDFTDIADSIDGALKLWRRGTSAAGQPDIGIAGLRLLETESWWTRT